MSKLAGSNFYVGVLIKTIELYCLSKLAKAVDIRVDLGRKGLVWYEKVKAGSHI